MPLTEVAVTPLPPQRFSRVLSPEALSRFERTIAGGRELLESRTFWNVNSTARGGGVAEMLHSLIAYSRGAGVDARWVVISGNEDFFRVTKRIHNMLHGTQGDGLGLGPDDEAVYLATAARWARWSGRSMRGAARPTPSCSPRRSAATTSCCCTIRRRRG